MKLKLTMHEIMKSLIEVINEGLFSKKKNNPLNLPDKMPKKYVDFLKNIFRKSEMMLKTKWMLKNILNTHAMSSGIW